METVDILDAARVGFAGLDAPPSAQETAIENLAVWLTEPRFTAYRSQIIALVERAQFRPLLDGFYRTLPFGTGARRPLPSPYIRRASGCDSATIPKPPD